MEIIIKRIEILNCAFDDLTPKMKDKMARLSAEVGN